MSRFDDELRLALRRQEPSADFADRVMARIAELSIESKQEKSREKASWLQRLAGFFQPRQTKWAMAGAMAIALIVAGVGVHRYRENERQRMLAEIAEGEKAKEQVMMAMRIASSKLNIAQKKINETTEREPDTK